MKKILWIKFSRVLQNHEIHENLVLKNFRLYTLLKQKYVIHTKIGMIQEFTPRIPLFGVNNIPKGMYYIPFYKYVFHSYIRMLFILLKYVLHTFTVCNTYFKVCIASLK